MDRRVLEERELEEAGTLAATEEIGNPIALAFHKYVVSNRDDLIDNATGAAVESVLKPHRGRGRHPVRLRAAAAVRGVLRHGDL